MQWISGWRRSCWITNRCRKQLNWFISDFCFELFCENSSINLISVLRGVKNDCLSHVRTHLKHNNNHWLLLQVKYWVNYDLISLWIFAFHSLSLQLINEFCSHFLFVPKNYNQTHRYLHQLIAIDCVHNHMMMIE